MATSPSTRLAALALALATAPSVARAANPGTYAVGNIPVAPGVLQLEAPIGGGFSVEGMGAAMAQGTYTERNPFTYLSLWGFSAGLHYDGVQNLRLTAAFQEFVSEPLPALGLKGTHEERGMVRARLQQPRGSAALYEMLQLDVRSFDDQAGVHRLVFRPRFRLGQGFNLDAERVHSFVMYEEVALRYATDADYASRAFDFFRAVLGYGWTTKRGTWVTLGVIGQVQLNPAATRYDLLFGPILALSHRFRPAKAAAPAEGEVPPAPPEIDVQ
jgi:hypothetical protein